MVSIGKALIAAVLVVIVIFLIISIQPATKTTSERTALVNKTVVNRIPDDISIASFTNLEHNYSKKVKIFGYLRQEMDIVDSNTTRARKYITDDHDNKVLLFLGYGVFDKYESLFPLNDTTNQTYEANGTLRFYSGDFTLLVQAIYPKDDTYTETNTTLSELETTNVTVTSEMQFNLSYGWRRVFG